MYVHSFPFLPPAGLLLDVLNPNEVSQAICRKNTYVLRRLAVVADQFDTDQFGLLQFALNRYNLAP